MGGKVCKTCQTEKPESEFYKSNSNTSGLQSECKECAKVRVKANRLEKADYYREFDRSRANNPERIAARSKYAKTESGKSSHAKSTTKWKESNRLRRWAQGKVSYALRSGKLEKLPCFVCGDLDTHAHHPDYSNPLAVAWLCPLCHKAAHAIAA